MATNTAEIKVGRLLEVRIAAGYRSVEDVDQLFTSLRAAVATLPPGVQHVTIADWTHCPVMTPMAADRLRTQIERTNALTQRSAVLAVTDLPTAVVQFLRVIREANHPDRRMFFSATELVAWLGEVLTPEETARARQFLTEFHAPVRRQTVA
jgi:hypothetical protein